MQTIPRLAAKENLPTEHIPKKAITDELEGEG